MREKEKKTKICLKRLKSISLSAFEFWFIINEFGILKEAICFKRKESLSGLLSAPVGRLKDLSGSVA